MFKNRTDAARQLVAKLIQYKNRADAIVLAIPRGGVVIGDILARALQLPLDFIMVKKLGHPMNPEFAIGAVTMHAYDLNYNFGIPDEYISSQVEYIRKHLKKSYSDYFGNRKPTNLKGKTLIVTDDGVATGSTLISSLKLVNSQGPKELIVAIPVGPSETIEKLKNYADKVICIEVPEHFNAIGQYYREFDQVSDSEVKRLIAMNRHLHSAVK